MEVCFCGMLYYEEFDEITIFSSQYYFLIKYNIHLIVLTITSDEPLCEFFNPRNTIFNPRNTWQQSAMLLQKLL